MGRLWLSATGVPPASERAERGEWRVGGGESFEVFLFLFLHLTRNGTDVNDQIVGGGGHWRVTVWRPDQTGPVRLPPQPDSDSIITQQLLESDARRVHDGRKCTMCVRIYFTNCSAFFAGVYR